MSRITRRNVLHAGVALAIPTGFATLIKETTATTINRDRKSGLTADEQANNSTDPTSKTAGETMQVQYLEIVTPDVDVLCEQYSKTHGVEFSEADASLGGARTAKLGDGGMIGIRGPLRDTETPVVRPYMLVEDIKAAVDAAAAAGAEVAIPPMKIPDHGMFAIVIQGGIECGFWQN